MSELVFLPSVVKASKMPSKESLNTHYQKYFHTNSIYSQPEQPEETKYRQAMAMAKLSMISHVTRRPLAESSLLEVGYGQGDFLDAAHKACKTVQGFDFSLESLRPEYKYLGEYCQAGNPDDLLRSAISADIKFELINATHVLEHSSEPEILIKNLADLTVAGGYIVIEIPNDFSPLQKELTEAGMVGNQYWISMPDHLCYWNKERFKKFISDSNLLIVDAFGDFPIELFLLTKDFNYKQHPELGKCAHLARCIISEYIISNVAMPEYLRLSRALYACDISRSYTYIITRA